MKKRGYFAVFFLGLTVSAIGLYRPQQTTLSPAAPPSPSPTPPPALLGIKAYTDSPGTDFNGDCFQQEGKLKKTLYLKAYGAFPVKPNTAKLGLYHYKADGSLEPLQVVVNYYYYGNTVKIAVTDSAPPHLGPGPYEAIVSTDIMQSRGLPTTVTGAIYYDTYKSDYHECWQE